MPSFFSQRPISRDNIEAYIFYMLYCGKGYTLEGIKAMYPDEMLRHGNRLKKQLDDEEKARKNEVQKSRAASGAARARMRIRR